MKITYRKKQELKGLFGTGIQIEFEKEEKSSVDSIVEKFKSLGYIITKSPISVNFYKNGSCFFGLQSRMDHENMLNESLPLLKEFDNTLTTEILFYDNYM